MRLRALLAVIVLVLLPHVARADSACPAALAEAQKAYDSGDFAQTVTLLRDGCRGKLSRTMAVQVQSLLARALMYDERPAEARKEVSKLLRLEPTFDDAAGSARFAELLAEVRREEQSAQVTSVSKSAESLREAPATVVVVTGEEIERRGYLDLEQLLHDLPGFDVNRTNGDIYSHVYQRGYFDEYNSRLLLIVDGVEQNDLTQGTEYLSRQYPLTNIDRVEVVYGPASTMYGANAYTGVISVVTKDAAALLGDKRFAILGHATTGSYGNRAIDMTMAGGTSGGTVTWSFAGNLQSGRERNLSALDPWDYTFRNVDYAALGIAPSRVELARQLDASFVAQNGLGFNDRAQNSGINAKVQISNLTLGLQSWRSEEGIASAYGSQTYSGNSVWTPEETALYAHYSARLSAGTLTVFSRYRQSSINQQNSKFVALAGYASGFLNSVDLARQRTPLTITLNGRALSTQIRNEISMAWQPTETFSGVTGIEFAKSSIQSQYDPVVTIDPSLGTVQIPLAETNYHTDAALWAQGSWKPRPSLRLVAAGRLSHNEINNSLHPEFSGFGSLVTGRFGVIYTPNRRLVFKAIYAEAFKDPTDTEKLAGYVFARNIFPTTNNFELRPERVQNAELSAGWETGEGTAVQLSAYQAHYRDVIGIVELPPSKNCPEPCLQNQNRDDARVRGLEATARHKLGPAGLWANYTHTQAVQSVPLTGHPGLTEIVRVPNIAKNQFNIGVDADWREWTAAVRTHYSGHRKIGRGTAFIIAPEYLGNSVAAYSTTAVALTYRDLLPNTALQFLADNVFDKQYYAVGSETLPSVLQAGRTISLRIIYRMK